MPQSTDCQTGIFSRTHLSQDTLDKFKILWRQQSKSNCFQLQDQSIENSRRKYGAQVHSSPPSSNCGLKLTFILLIWIYDYQKSL